MGLRIPSVKIARHANGCSIGIGVVELHKGRREIAHRRVVHLDVVPRRVGDACDPVLRIQRVGIEKPILIILALGQIVGLIIDRLLDKLHSATIGMPQTVAIRRSSDFLDTILCAGQRC